MDFFLIFLLFGVARSLLFIKPHQQFYLLKPFRHILTPHTSQRITNLSQRDVILYTFKSYALQKDIACLEFLVFRARRVPRGLDGLRGRQPLVAR